jgi:hypothetical protein
METMSFTARLKDFFGYLPGQSLSDFAKEIRALTTEDKLEFHAAFNALGMPTEMPKVI